MSVLLKFFLLSSILFPSILVAGETVEVRSGSELYQLYCAFCHHPQRYGVSGPPLIQETMEKRKDEELAKIIKKGLTATNMPSFETSLKDEDIQKIVEFIKGPVQSPVWGMDEILATRNMSDKAGLSPRPEPDMSNLFMIVEGGKGIVHFMDGDTFRLLDQAKVGAIHGGPKFANDLKRAYLQGRDGWIVRYDLVSWRETGRIRVGINTRNIAVSSDGKIVAVANALPENIVFLDSGTLNPVKIIGFDSKPGAVYALKKRNSFLLSFREKSEIWLIDYSNMNVEKFSVDQPFSDFFIEPEERYIVGTSRGGKTMSVVDLDTKKVIGTMATEGMPHLASAAFWGDGERTMAAFPHIKNAKLTVAELGKWEVTANINLPGAGFFARTHDNIPHIWVDSGTDTVYLVDKKDLKISAQVTPAPGKKAMHIEFSKDGRHALVSIWEDDGGVVIYDTSTLKEVKRLPFAKPIGKYNATNKKY